MNDTKFLEAAASLHFLLKTRRITDDEAVGKVAGKMPNTSESYVRKVLVHIRSEGLL